ncbi:Zn-dependent hydrolase, glyoxylase [Rivularia sp. PCC 7116]|uniref:MBL fold metallo-hydrolase n=1 Tax=Rivularia sp. PCC 7116 TaxID=373994 RepID=UPI00029EE99F|nr:MBL fold metallo-hydrolase [Rivularia sp. PCC 7116]AFY55511.1 Zn-dependent hydrolase, glyoxylase [Rivularia sp. PCC 7116]
MATQIKPINLLLPLNLGSVNCYLLQNGTDYILIDTGSSNIRTEIEGVLKSAGCKPGNLKLIILTHGDFDHTGNAAYLRNRFATKIAMHSSDSGMLERGDMFFNRKKPNILLGIMLPIIPIIFGFGNLEKCKPDLYLDDGYDLSKYGFDAKVIDLPGHSKGSIGILLEGTGDLFCGDLLENIDKPAFSSIIDDLEAANSSVEKLKSLKINTVYPGHGEPFAMKLFADNNKQIKQKGKSI